MKTKIKNYLWKIVKTMAETLSGFAIVGVGFEEINWLHALSVTLVSGIAAAVININDVKPDGVENA